MIEVEEALRLVLAEAKPGHVIVDTQATFASGATLAEEIFSDIDSPPHDKSIVDGFAVRYGDCQSAPVELEVVEQVTAGQVPKKTIGPGQTTRIMTGAPIPGGADAVVMVERTEILQAPRKHVRILQPGVRPNQNIVRRGQSLRVGDRVLAAGKILRAADVGLLYEVGRTKVKCLCPPLVSIIVTGNELVPAVQMPRTGQLRNSNGPMLAALVRECRVLPASEGESIATDDEVALRTTIQGSLSDVLILSGGVSEGVLDLVPRVLQDLGVRQIFHKVNLKPGKPIWFGVKEHEDGRRTLVFGLPGNPVSTLVCFQLFVRPALEKLAGREPRGMERFSAQLTIPFSSRGDRPTYWPGKSMAEDPRGLNLDGNSQLAPPTPGVSGGLGQIQRPPGAAFEATTTMRSPDPGGLSFVQPLPWQGSGDLRTLADADCLIFFPPGQIEYAAGDRVTAFRL